MTGAELLAALAAFATAYGPAIEQVILEVIADFKAQHPEIGDPPPADGVAAIDATIDMEVAAKAPKAST